MKKEEAEDISHEGESTLDAEQSALKSAIKRSAIATSKLMQNIWPVIRADSYLSNVSSDGDGDRLSNIGEEETTPGTVIAMVIDRSISMRRLWGSVVRGIDSFLVSHKRAGGRAVYSLRLFAASQLVLYSFVPSNKARGIPADARLDAKLECGTALYDAIGMEIDAIEKWQKSNSAFERVVLLIMSASGEQNSSKIHNDRDKLRAKIEECRAKNWQVTLLGAEFDAAETGKDIGIASTVTCSYATINDSFRHASVASTQYRASNIPSELVVDLTAEEVLDKARRT